LWEKRLLPVGGFRDVQGGGESRWRGGKNKRKKKGGEKKEGLTPLHFRGKKKKKKRIF